MSLVLPLPDGLGSRESGAGGRGDVPCLRVERLSGLPVVAACDDRGANRVNVVLCLRSPRRTATARQHVLFYPRQIWFLDKHPQTVPFQIVI